VQKTFLCGQITLLHVLSLSATQIFRTKWFCDVCLYRFSAESPRWLLSRNQVKKSEDVLARMARVNGKNFDDIIAKLEAEQSNTSLVSSLIILEYPNKPSDSRTQSFALLGNYDVTCSCLYADLYCWHFVDTTSTVNKRLIKKVRIRADCVKGVCVYLAPVLTLKQTLVVWWHHLEHR